MQTKTILIINRKNSTWLCCSSFASCFNHPLPSRIFGICFVGKWLLWSKTSAPTEHHRPQLFCISLSCKRRLQLRTQCLRRPLSFTLSSARRRRRDYLFCPRIFSTCQLWFLIILSPWGAPSLKANKTDENNHLMRASPPATVPNSSSDTQPAIPGTFYGKVKEKFKFKELCSNFNTKIIELACHACIDQLLCPWCQGKFCEMKTNNLEELSLKFSVQWAKKYISFGKNIHFKRTSDPRVENNFCGLEVCWPPLVKVWCQLLCVQKILFLG